MKDNELNVAFAAVEQKAVELIPENITISTNSTGYVLWGRNNKYPVFLFDCYKKCPTLQSILNGYVDYIGGNGVTGTILGKPNKLQTWDEFISRISSDYMIFGIAYIQVIRDKAGNVAELYWLDARFMRMDEENEMFVYNKDFGSSYTRNRKSLTYPKYVKGGDETASIFCIKTPFSRDVYGTPIWESAVRDVQVEMGISEYHLSELDNGFFSSAIINFNNGIPTQDQQAEIERLVVKKFTSPKNAGRFMLSFNNGKDNMTTVQKLGTDDFDKRYISLKEKTSENIYASLRVNPQLFGIINKTGFATQDYAEAFRIFNRTSIYPIQMRLIDAIDYILGVKGSISIKPFAIDFTEEDTDNNTEIVN